MRSTSQPTKVSNLTQTYANLNLSSYQQLCFSRLLEIIGYAEFLGMDLEEDADLLYIAEEGLKAPVPEPWKAFSNE